MAQWSIQVKNHITFFEAPIEGEELDGAILATDPGVYYRLKEIDREWEGRSAFYKFPICFFKGHVYRLAYAHADAEIICDRCGKRRPDPS